MSTITVEQDIHAPLEKVWSYYNEPQHITTWNAASADWHTPEATNDLRVGGTFNYRMEAKDGSQGFDLVGTYNEIVPDKKIAYTMGDGRKVSVEFSQKEGAVHITVTFDAEKINSLEMQRNGWQSILNNFKNYAESH